MINNRSLDKRQKRKARQQIVGNATRPRLAIYRSLNNLFAQLIDDEKGRTLAAVSSIKITGSLTDKAARVGSEIAKKATAKKINTVVFDRGGFPYKGTVKILADKARNGGLKF